MTTAYTCPHCETALALPESSPAARVLCPRCGATIPHPDAPVGGRDPGRIAFATAPDDDAWQQFSQRYHGRVTLLSMFGAALTWIGSMMGIPFAVQVTGSNAVGTMIFVATTIIVFNLNLFGIHWIEREQRREKLILGWIVTGIFAIIGGIGLGALVLLVGVRLLKAL